MKHLIFEREDERKREYEGMASPEERQGHNDRTEG